MKHKLHLLGSVLALASAAPLAGNANAAPAISSAVAAVPAQASTPVQYRRWDGRHHYYRHQRRGWGPGAVIGGLVTGAIIADAIREDRVSDDAIAECEAHFQSFDPATGTYTTYSGETRVCPYLG